MSPALPLYHSGQSNVDNLAEGRGVDDVNSFVDKMAALQQATVSWSRLMGVKVIPSSVPRCLRKTSLPTDNELLEDREKLLAALMMQKKEKEELCREVTLRSAAAGGLSQRLKHSEGGGRAGALVPLGNLAAVVACLTRREVLELAPHPYSASLTTSEP
ncbi:hypothetical protein GWK47_027309 [Chionoecetes opilio]|uniref:Uncharacterized protein n=1 Tax=Chionoecetes opilio TaxID=41210 RepID=A0A8J8WNF7_CHIOP|nr:hypothetical protein GWK47_027309 [Chionoecetes opilio]